MKSPYRLVLIAILGVGLLMVGCGAPPLEGEWNKCNDWTSYGYSAYPITEVYTTDQVAKTFANAGTTPGCTGDLIFDVVTLYDYTLPDGDLVDGVNNIDLTVVSVTVTPYNQAQTDCFNGIPLDPNDPEDPCLISECGLDTWALNTPQDVTGLLCYNTNYYAMDTGASLFEVVSWTEADPDVLYIPAKQATPDSGQRETELDPLPMDRQ